MTDCGHLALIASGEGRGLCVLCQQAEIERLRALKTPASRRLLNITKGCLDEAEAEIERLTADREQYNGWAEEIKVNFAAIKADNELLRAAIQRIDGINDNPADYNPEINVVCDTILRPALKDTKP